MDDCEHLVVIAWVHKRCYALCCDLQLADLITLSVKALAHLVEFRPKILPEERKQPLIVQSLEERVRHECLMVTVDQDRYSQLRRQVLNEFAER